MAHTTHQPEATLSNGNTSRLDALINSSKEKLRKPIAAVAVLIGATALAACDPAEGATTTPSNTPTVEHTIDPTETSSPTPTETTPTTNHPEASSTLNAEDFEIAANLPPEELANRISEVSTAWLNSGIYDGMRDEYIKYLNDNNLPSGDESMIKWATARAEEHAEVFTNTIYVDGWENIDSLSETAANHIDTNAGNIRNNLIQQAKGESALLNPADTNIKVNKVTKTDTGKSIEVCSISENSTGTQKVQGCMLYELVTVGDVEKISNIKLISIESIG